ERPGAVGADGVGAIGRIGVALLDGQARRPSARAAGALARAHLAAAAAAVVGGVDGHLAAVAVVVVAVGITGIAGAPARAGPAAAGSRSRTCRPSTSGRRGTPWRTARNWCCRSAGSRTVHCSW